MSEFQGLGVAMITPFKKGKVDYKALEKITEHLVEGGADYLVALGTTGESVTLSTRECRAIFDCILNVNNDRLPVVAGYFGENNTALAVDRIKKFDFTGFSGILSSSPAYNKPSQEGIYQHYMRIADASPVPVILYNVPGRTASNVLPETTLRLAEDHANVVAIKEASGDIAQASEIIKNAPQNFDVLSGDDPTALALIACGGKGLISVIGNAFPRATADMVHHAMEEEMEIAQKLNIDLFDFHDLLYVDGNPCGIKGLMELMNFCTTEVRLPLVPLRDETKTLLENTLQYYNAKTPA